MVVVVAVAFDVVVVVVAVIEVVVLVVAAVVRAAHSAPCCSTVPVAVAQHGKQIGNCWGVNGRCNTGVEGAAGAFGQRLHFLGHHCLIIAAVRPG